MSETKPQKVFNIADFDYVKEDNWGGEQEKRVEEETLTNLSSLMSFLPVGNICPGCNGAIGIVYRTSTSYMYIEILKDKASIYVERNKEKEQCEENLPFEEVLKKAINWWN